MVKVNNIKVYQKSLLREISQPDWHKTNLYWP